MHAFPLIQRIPIASQSLRFRTMSASILPSSISLQNISFNSSNKKRCNSSSSKLVGGFVNEVRSVKHNPRNLDKSRVFMSVSVGSKTAVDDALFADYKPTCAFLFPGQVIKKNSEFSFFNGRLGFGEGEI